MKTWTTKDGTEIEYSKLEDSHLLNILSFIEKRAEEGVIISYGGGGNDEEMWGDIDELIGDDVKEHFDFNGLAKEALKRGLLTTNEYLLRIT